MNTKKVIKPTKKQKKSADEILAGIAKRPLTLGWLLWAIRIGDEMTQVEFSAQLGVSKQYLCDVEHERRFISPKMAEAFAKKLGYSAEQFIRLSLQGMLDRDGVEYLVELKAA